MTFEKQRKWDGSGKVGAAISFRRGGSEMFLNRWALELVDLEAGDEVDLLFDAETGKIGIAPNPSFGQYPVRRRSGTHGVAVTSHAFVRSFGIRHLRRLPVHVEDLPDGRKMLVAQLPEGGWCS